MNEAVTYIFFAMGTMAELGTMGKFGAMAEEHQVNQMVMEKQSAEECVEYNVSYVYHALYAYFDRDNVAPKGLAK